MITNLWDDHLWILWCISNDVIATDPKKTSQSDSWQLSVRAEGTLRLRLLTARASIPQPQALSHPHDDRLRVNLCFVYSAAFVSSNTADSLHPPDLSDLHAEIKSPYKSATIKDFLSSGLGTHKVEQLNGCGRSLPFFFLPVCMKRFFSTAAAYLFSIQRQELERKSNALCRQSHASWERWMHLERHCSVSYYLQLIKMLQDNENHCLSSERYPRAWREVHPVHLHACCKRVWAT